MTVTSGIVLGDYRLPGRIDPGGTGDVRLAEQVRFEKRCAVDTLPEEPVADKRFGGHFRLGAPLVAETDHPNIVGMHHFGRTSGSDAIDQGGSLSVLLVVQ